MLSLPSRKLLKAEVIPDINLPLQDTAQTDLKRKRDNKYPEKFAFGFHIESQIQVIQTMSKILANIRVPTAKGTLRATLPFMNGLRQCVLALTLLKDDLHNKGIKHYLQTVKSKLHGESFFANSWNGSTLQSYPHQMKP